MNDNDTWAEDLAKKVEDIMASEPNPQILQLKTAADSLDKLDAVSVPVTRHDANMPLANEFTSWDFDRLAALCDRKMPYWMFMRKMERIRDICVEREELYPYEDIFVRVCRAQQQWAEETYSMSR